MDAEDSFKLAETLQMIMEYLKTAMVAELQAQGHANTGGLVDSIEGVIINRTNFVQLDGMFNFYGRFVDTGRRTGVRKVPIYALMQWIRQKGFESDAKKVKGMAFAIQKSIFNKGISTPQSWKGTSTRDWMTKTLTKNESRIADDIFNSVDSALDIIIDNLVRETNTSIRGNTVKLFAA